jgi:GTP-binding protein Era
MTYVQEAIEEADIIAVIADVEAFIKYGEFIPHQILDQIKASRIPAILLINKTDLLHDKKDMLPLLAKVHETGIFKDVIPISSLKKDNLNDFINTAKKYLPEGPFFYDPEILSSQPQRFFVSELIREQVFLEYREEIPYSCEVNIIEFNEREFGKWHIHAEIIVERQSQKGIIIGEKGLKLKKVGEISRLKIEDHLGVPVYLQLFVKVRENWRSNRNMLRSFGY